MLTTAANVHALTSGNDTVDGTTTLDSLNDGDVVTDPSATDADVLSANVTGSAQKPVIVNVETLNINARYGDGGLDLTSVTGATTINAASTTAAGTLKFINVTSTAVKTIAAGTNASTLEVTAKDVAAGTAGAVTVKGATGTSTMTVTGNQGTDTFNIEMAGAGTLNLDGNGGTDTYSIKLAGGSTTVKGDAANETVNFESAASANTVTVDTALFAATGKSTITGDKDFTLKTTTGLISGGTFTDSTTAGTTKVEITGTTAGNDLSKVAVDEIEIKTISTTGDDLKFANGATVRMSNNNANVLEINAVGSSDAITFIANGQVAVTNDATKFVTVNMSNTKDVVADMNLAGDATLNLSGDYKFTLDGDTTAKHVDATALKGKLVAVVDAALLKITGGDGADEITATDVNIAAGGVEQTYQISTGAGDDKVTVAGTATFDTDADNKMIIDGGTGSNTLVTGTTSTINFSNFAGGMASTITGFGTFDLTAASLTLGQKQGLTNGNTYVVKGDGAADIFTIAVVDNGGSPYVDMSGVTVSGLATLVINAGAYTAGTTTLTGSSTVGTTIVGSAQKDVVVGGSGVDTIYTKAGADQITGGLGADLFLIGATADMTTADNVRKITDFVAGTDKFKIVVNDSAGVNITGDLSAAGAVLAGVTFDGTGDAVKAMGDIIASTTSVATIADVYTKLATLLDATALEASAADGTATVARVVEFTAGAAAGKYLVLNDSTGGFAAADDIVINITGVSGTVAATDFIFSAT